jgi:uncharacterized delta-60 repeat protein
MSFYSKIRTSLFSSLLGAWLTVSIVAFPGGLDPTFGIRGKVVTSVNSFSTDKLSAVAVQADGKIVGVGSTDPEPGAVHCLVARYLPDGTLDPSFNLIGLKILTIVDDANNDPGQAVSVLSDGKILIAGSAYLGPNTRGDFYLVRLNADGTFDDSFGTNGKVFVDFSLHNDNAYAMAVQNDGKIVVGGQTTVDGNFYNFALARFNEDGSLDNSFGTGGKVTRGPATFASQIWDLKIQADGKIVAGGWLFGGTENNFATLRYNSDGSPDTSFDSDGIAVTPMGSTVFAFSVNIQSDGKIITSGGGTVGNNPPVHVFASARYDSNGTLDTTFDTDGKVFTAFGGLTADGRDAVLQADGKLVVAGFAGGRFAVARYNPNGSLDTSFNGTGKVLTAFDGLEDSVASAALTPDGKVLLGGYTLTLGSVGRELALARYTTDGLLDQTFGPPGYTATTLQGYDDTANAVTIQPDGRIVAVGKTRNSGTNYDFGVVRFRADGTLDPFFGSSGRAFRSLGSAQEEPEAVAIQFDGKIVVAGYTGAGSASNFAVVRFNPNALINNPVDTTFGTNGTVVLPVGAAQDIAYDIAIQPDGKLLLGGSAVINSGADFALVRLTPNGTPDSSFGVNGVVTTALSSGDDVVRSIKIQPDGKIVAAGYATSVVQNADVALVRYNADGSLDNSFGIGGKVVTSIGSSDDKGFATALQGDGRIVVAGSSMGMTDNDFAVLRYNGDGSLDASFSGDGIVTTPILPTSNDSGNAVSIQSDGRIIVGGGAMTDVSGQQNPDVCLARYNPNGSLDTTFNGGVVVTDYGNRGEVIRGMTLQSDGKVLAAGNITNAVRNYFMVLRYSVDPDPSPTPPPPTPTPGITPTPGPTVTPTPTVTPSPGALDSSFGTDGHIAIDFDFTSDRGRDMTIQPDDRIVVAGTISAGPNDDFGVARLNPNGTLDQSFGVGGLVRTPFDTFNSQDRAWCTALQPDGKILVSGTWARAGSPMEIAAVRYNSNGSLDTTFDGDGIFQLPQSGLTFISDIAVQADGKIVIGGSANGLIAIRLNPNGSLDTSFDGDGILIPGFGQQASAIAIQPDQKIIFGGFATITGNNTDFALLRCNPDGSPDNTFGTSGRVTTPIGPGSAQDSINRLVLQPDGKIIGAGGTSDGGQGVGASALVRYNSDGSLDLSFAAGGKAIDRLGIGTSYITGIALDTIGRPVVSAAAQFFNNSNDFTVARYTSNGLLDPSFGSGGVSGMPFSVTEDTSAAVASQSDGKIVAAGWGEGDFFLTRYFSGEVAGPTPTPTPTLIPTPSPTPTPTPTPTPMPTPSPSPTGRTLFDFDGDHKADVSVFRPSVGEWYYQQSASGVVSGFGFGNSSDKPVPADFTGDGKTDIAFFRPSESTWYVLRSEDLTFYAFPFGASSDVPAPADFDGDGEADPTVYRPSAQTWFILRSTGGVLSVPFGLPNDVPEPADYDGDGMADVGIYRPDVGQWWHLRSSNGSVFAASFGSSTDKPTPGDYTGDGKADIAFFRPSEGNWYVLRSEDQSFYAFPFGNSADKPAPADFDGDGKYDAAIFRPSDTNWYILKSTGGVQIQQFGAANDIPLPGAFVP